MLASRFGSRLTQAVFAACALAAFAVPNARADFDAATTTLQDLINAGSTGLTIGDKTFYNFSYQGSPATAAQIGVTRSDTSNIGLRFSFNWSSANGVNEDSVIRYCVHVNDTTPQNFINGVGLDFNGTANPAGVLTSASVTETITDLAGNELPGGLISVIDSGPGASGNRDSASYTVNPAVRDLCVTKDISVHSAPANLQGGTATISFVDNTFSQVPEPASLGLVGAGALLMIKRRR
jgi:hypothetical protein